ncbi:MAG: hypothetical protein R6V05_07925 [Candidatus Brocadiia bacterium]
MRVGRLILGLIFLLLSAGCGISRHIVEIPPPDQPSLQQIEQHLDYQDPDAGEPDYVIVEQ